MDNPGTYSLIAMAITTALAPSFTTEIDDLDGMAEVTLTANFGYGSGGVNCSAVVQTTFDEGVTWLDIARFDFTTASAIKSCTLSAAAFKGITGYVALASEGVNDGLLGNALRCAVTSSGTYVNSSIAVNAAVRG